MSDIDPRLLELLACPCPHHAPVDPDPSASGLACRRCGTVFPVRDGIPVMLLSEATPGPSGRVGEV